MSGARRRRALAVAGLGLLVLAWGCAGERADEPAVVVEVDGLEMTEDDVLRSYLDYLITTGQSDTEALRERHVEALIDAYLLGAEAERRGLAADSAVVRQSRQARRRLVGSRYFEAAVFDTLAAPTEAEVRRAFELGSEQRVVRQLYFTDPGEAAAAYARLQGGRSFLEEAQALYSTKDSLAGSLGAVSYWQLDDAFAEAAFSTPVGEITPPVRTRLGTHIILVEDRLRNPLLTESEFERRRRGVESQLKLRRRRLEGDAFVRDFMAERNVSVSREALRALSDAIAGLEEEVLPDARQGSTAPFTTVEKASLLDTFGPSTPLAVFESGGEMQTFTVADYVSWLDVLPPGEARNRPGASLGRALRNEALARAGEAAGIAETPEVQRELARMERLRLADALRARLREEASADTTQLSRVAADLRLTPRQTVVDFWSVPFATRAAAEQALPGLRASPDRAQTRTGFRAYEATPLADIPSYAAAVRGAPLGEPVLASVGEGEWAVVRVSDRRTETVGTGADALAPFAAEAELIQRLRRQRPVDKNASALQRVLSPPPVPQARR